jgi:hypothetical protein
MKLAWIAGVMLMLTPWFTGCGDGGGANSSSSSSSSSNSSNSSNSNTLEYLFGERLGVSVYMQPAPPAYTFPSWSGTAPGIRIDEVIQFSSTVNPEGAGIYEPTTQVAFGQVTGPITGKEVLVYSYTNEYYIQPLTSTTININGDLTWIAPSHPGQISALLVAQGYAAPATTSTLPAVDGSNVFAVATAGVNASISPAAIEGPAVVGGVSPLQSATDATPQEQRAASPHREDIPDANTTFSPITNSTALSRGETVDEVTEILGQPQTSAMIGAKVIYVYKDVTVTFVNGKVTDSQ